MRVGGKTAYDEDVFSSTKQAPLYISTYDKHEPAWPKPARDGDLGAQAMFHAKAIDDELAQPPADWLVVTRDYATQSADTAALEPDNANGWYDAAKQELHLVVPTQSPQEVAEGAAEPAGEKPPRPEAPVPASVLHGRLRLQGPQPAAVLRPGGRRLWRRPAGARWPTTASSISRPA